MTLANKSAIILYFYSFSAYYAYLGAHLRLYVYIFLTAFYAVGATVPKLSILKIFACRK